MEELQPTASVIIPVYNAERFLKACLESAFAQTFRDFEVIVVDDGSTDRSAEIYRQYDVSLVQQVNHGLSHARNRGVEAARGRYIAFLDHDDAWYPQRLSRSVEVLDRDRDVALVYSDLDHIDMNGAVIEHAFQHAKGQTGEESLRDYLEGRMHISPSTVTMRKETFQALGGFDERLRSLEDTDFFSRVFGSFRICYIDEPLVQWRSHPDQLSRGRRYQESSGIHMHNLLRRFPDRPEQDEYLTRDVIVPRFLDYFWTAYLMMLQSVPPHFDPEADRRELRFLLHYVDGAPLLPRLLARMPYPLAHMLYRVAMKLPWRRYLREQSGLTPWPRRPAREVEEPE